MSTRKEPKKFQDTLGTREGKKNECEIEFDKNLNRGRSMRKVAKVRAEERAAMAAQRATHSEANHCSSSEKKGFEQGSRQSATEPTPIDRLERRSPASNRTSGGRHQQEQSSPLPRGSPRPEFASDGNLPRNDIGEQKRLLIP